jgi:hypothetical protein
MHRLLRMGVVSIFLLVVSGCNEETNRQMTQERVIQFSQPSLAGIADQAQPKALAAYDHAKRFVSDGDVDSSAFDLMKPDVSHWCPPQAVYFDWLVSFPNSKAGSEAGSALSIAVLNDGKCWIWQAVANAAHTPH